MNSRPAAKHDFPMRFGLKGRSVVLRPLAAEDREPLITFAGDLPEDDLLFLERDITRPAEVDAWIKDTLEGRLATLLALEDDVVLGYATFNRGNVRWTCHVAECAWSSRNRPAESASAGSCWSWPSKWSRTCR